MAPAAKCWSINIISRKNDIQSKQRIALKLDYKCYNYHRLNGSSSPVLTATSLSYGKAKNSPPTESKPLTRLR